MAKVRLVYIDVLRVLACFLVILTHSALPSLHPENDGFWLFMYSFIASPSSELFLALSGAVLLPVKAHVSMRDFYKRRFLKLLPPVLIWSILVVFVYVLMGKLTWMQGFRAISMIPLQPVIGIYWFIYVIIGLYLLAPIISKWLLDASKKQVELFLGLWLLNLMMPYVNFLIPGFYQQSGTHYWSLNYFGGFLGYWMLGFYLRKYPILLGWNKKFVILCLLVVCYPILILYLKLQSIDVSPYMDNLQLGSAVLVTFIFTVVQSIKKYPDFFIRIISEVAKYSFGIYLVHILIVRELVWYIVGQYRFHPLFETPIIALASLLISYLCLRVISKLPYGKYITGT